MEMGVCLLGRRKHEVVMREGPKHFVYGSKSRSKKGVKAFRCGVSLCFAAKNNLLERKKVGLFF